MFPRILLLGVVACLMVCSQRAAAQQVAVQQPVVSVFRANTTVSVPDRGSAYLGGVSSAASGRSSNGPLRTGSSLGWNREASSASAHVSIHDLQAIDEALLAAAESPRKSQVDPRIVSRLDQRGRSDTVPSAAVTDAAPLTADAVRLAEQAESRGKFAVAKLHWERAARHGSERAVRRLTAPEFAAVTPRRSSTSPSR